MQRGHAEALMPLIARVMDGAAVEFKELDRIAVTIGPGSFTGLRVGISAARGIALAAGKPAIGLIDARRLRGAAHRGRRHAAGRGGDRCPPRSRLSPGVRPGGRTLVAPRVAPLREARAGSADRTRPASSARLPS